MALALFLLFIVVPFVELAVIITVGGQIGAFPTIGLLILVGVVGSWLCKREGLGVLRRMNVALNQGQLPTRELIDGGLILFAGALMITPGFLTDVVGILLLFPPSRAMFRTALVRRFKGRIERAVTFGRPASFAGDGFGPFGGFAGRVFVDNDVMDTTATDSTPRRGSATPPPELGRY
jgi:UPF0716 protein FxsA